MEENPVEARKAGKEALLSALKNENKLFANCTTLEEATRQEDLIAKVKELHLHSRKYIVLPSAIWQCKALTHLNLSGCKLRSLSYEIGQCTALTELDVSKNNLMSLPEKIQNCPLKRLHLKDNSFEAGYVEQILRPLLPNTEITY